MPEWKCSNCDYALTEKNPPHRCPSCDEVCEFVNVTCYIPECEDERRDLRL